MNQEEWARVIAMQSRPSIFTRIIDYDYWPTWLLVTCFAIFAVDAIVGLVSGTLQFHQFCSGWLVCSFMRSITDRTK